MQICSFEVIVYVVLTLLLQHAMRMLLHCITPFTQNYLDRDLNNINLDRDPDQVPIYPSHSLFDITKCVPFVFIVQSLLMVQIAIHVISGLKLSRLLSRARVYTAQNFSIQIAIKIILLCVNRVYNSYMKSP